MKILSIAAHEYKVIVGNLPYIEKTVIIYLLLFFNEKEDRKVKCEVWDNLTLSLKFKKWSNYW